MLADGYICTTNEPNTVNITNQSTAIFYQQKSGFILAFHCSFIKLSLLRQMTAIMWLMLFGKQIPAQLLQYYNPITGQVHALHLIYSENIAFHAKYNFFMK